MTLRLLRNKVVEVEAQTDGDLIVSWRLTDDLLKVDLELRIQPPDLEIIGAEARLTRFAPQIWENAPELIKKIEGVRVGAGLRKIVEGILGGPKGCPLLVFGVLESCNAAILHYTRPGIESREGLGVEQKIAAIRENLKRNPRLIRSCIAFQDDSSFMQGLLEEKK